MEQARHGSNSVRQQMEDECIEKVRTARQEWRAASDEYSRVRTDHRDALDTLNGTFDVRQAATKERIALEKYQRATESFRDLFGDLPFSAID